MNICNWLEQVDYFAGKDDAKKKLFHNFMYDYK